MGRVWLGFRSRRGRRDEGIGRGVAFFRCLRCRGCPRIGGIGASLRGGGTRRRRCWMTSTSVVDDLDQDRGRRS